jgi:hypothetical protein
MFSSYVYTLLTALSHSQGKTTPFHITNLIKSELFHISSENNL